MAIYVGELIAASCWRVGEDTLIRTLRRIAATITVIGTVTAGMVVTTAGAAHAGDCRTPPATISFVNGTLSGHRWMICRGSPTFRIRQPVTIERLTRQPQPLPPDPPRPPIWVVVAQGSGDVAYTCQGSVANSFRVNGGQAGGVYACS
jgi:hypothetical protein